MDIKKEPQEEYIDMTEYEEPLSSMVYLEPSFSTIKEMWKEIWN